MGALGGTWRLADVISRVAGHGQASSSSAATVTRVDDDGTVWVMLAGSDVETPVNGALTSNAQPGESVSVEVSGGRLSLVGNGSDPAVGAEYVDDAIRPVAALGGLAKSVADAARRAAAAAEGIAREARDVAEAAGQHFWQRATDPDSDGAGTGAFVTDDEREAFLAAAAAGFPDLGSETETMSQTDTWEGDGETVTFALSHEATDLSYTVSVGGAQVLSGVTKANDKVTFDTAPASGAAISATYTRYKKPWHNLLMNSLGILLRSGLKNLVSITRSAVAFYDGLGNDATNVVASFGSNGVRVGKQAGNHITAETDGIYGWYGDKLIFGAQNNNGAAELYLGQNEATIPIGGSLMEFDQNGAFISHITYMTGGIWQSPASTYPVPPNAGRSEHRPSSPISSGHFEFTSDGDGYYEFRLYDSGDVMYLKVLRKSLGSSSERTGISPHSYVVPYLGAYYELAWFDGTGTEISTQHENIFVMASYLLSPQWYEFGNDGIIMRRDSTKPSIRFCDDELMPFFIKAGWDETFDQSELPALPCIVMNILDRRLWMCDSDSIRPIGNIRGADSLASDSATADGANVEASGDYSHAQNLGTVASEDAQTAIGKYNANAADAAFIVGNGTSDSDRSNAFWANWNGRVGMGRLLMLRSDEFTGLGSENFVGLYVVTKNREAWAFRVFGSDADGYGDAIVIGDGGLFVAGAGESAENMYNAIIAAGSNQGREDAFLTADDTVYIVPNCNTIANRIEYNFGSGGLNMKKKTINELNNIEFNPKSNTSNHGGFLDFHYNQSTEDYTSRIIEDKSGELRVTGVLKVNSEILRTPPSLDIKQSNNGVSSTQWYGLTITDKNSYNSSRFLSQIDSSGRIGTGMWVYNRNTSGTQVAGAGFNIYMDKSGTVTYAVPTPANFRSAISAASTSAATQSAAGLMSAADKKKLDGIATGAQVNPGASFATSGIISAASGITITVQQAAVYASHVVQVTIRFKPTAAKSGNVTIGTLTANYRPAYQAGAQVAFGGAGSTGWVDGGGACNVRMGNLTAGTEYYFWSTFVR